jgi:hypothetical protein
MTRIPNTNGTLSSYNISSEEIQDGDLYGYKIVALITGNYWCAYKGSTDWEDWKIAAEGDAILFDTAVKLFPTIANTHTWSD